MCVEASDAVSVTHECADVATSSDEIVTGDHFAELAEMTVCAVCETECDEMYPKLTTDTDTALANYETMV